MVDKMAEDALTILQDEESLVRFRKAALEQAERFDIEAILPQYEQYYEQVLEESKPKVNDEAEVVEDPCA